jgi:hypothetical protein
MRDVLSVVADNISTTTTNTARIIVTPNAKRPGLYDACLDDGGVLIIASRQPFLDAARRLLDLGYDPTIVLVMEHGCLTAQIGAAAKLRVKEDRRGPRFVDWEPISRRVGALVSAKAKRVDWVAPDDANEPSLRPGAASATQFPPLAPRSSRPVRRQTDRITAERQRRYSERRRKGDTVTHRGAEGGVTSKIKKDARR